MRFARPLELLDEPKGGDGHLRPDVPEMMTCGATVAAALAAASSLAPSNITVPMQRGETFPTTSAEDAGPAASSSSFHHRDHNERGRPGGRAKLILSP